VGDIGSVDRLRGGDRDAAGGQIDGDALDAGIRLISSVTARWQFPQVMPATWNVVAPTKVRGVSSSMSFSLVG
jgi:hypothetical protein